MSTSLQTATTRTIYLRCPSLSKLVPFVALVDRGLDLGTVARVFAIHPSTLRLNGHFLGRGHDLISSVSCKSLLAFFAKRGFSTGDTASDAVVVDGKHLEDGCMSDCDQGPASGLRGNCDQAQEVDDISGLGIKRKLNMNSYSFVKKRKMDHFEEGPFGKADDSEAVKDNGFSSKRKLHMDDFSLTKRSRTDQSSLGGKPHLCNTLSTSINEDCVGNSLKDRNSQLALTTVPNR